MAQLNIYDKFGTRIESYTFSGSLTSWIKANVPSYRDTVRPPYSATLNSNPWPFDLHDEALLDSDVIDMSIDPDGLTPLEWIYLIVTIASAAYSFYQANNLPDYQKTRADGESIYAPNARVNSAKPSGIVREMGGQIRVFPDLICPVTRRYIDHEEYIYLMMSVTAGYAFLTEKNVYIAETGIVKYAGDYTLNIYEPGDTVTGNRAHENWHQTREVSGLELVTSTNTLIGDWKLSYVSSGGSPFISTITSFFDDDMVEFPFPVGALIRINTGSNPGLYIVDSINSPNTSANVIKQASLGGDGPITKLAYASSRGGTTSLGGRGIGGGRAPSGQTVYGAGIGGRPRIIPNTEDDPSFLTPVSPIESVSWEALNGGVNWEGPFELVPEGEAARYVEVDVNFSGGLFEFNSSGDLVDTTVEILIQYREVGSSTWTTATDTSRSPNTTTYTAGTVDELGFTVEIDLGSEIRPEMRFRRVTNDSNDVSITDNVFIKRVRSKLETPTSYPGITTMALIIRGTNALAATAENLINIRGATRKLPTLTEIEDAANGTLYDISASATQTTGDYLVTDDSSLIGVFDIANGAFPKSIDQRISFHMSEDGLYFLTYDGELRSYQLNTAYSLSGGYTISSSYTAATTKLGNAMWLDGGSKLAYMNRFKDPVNFTTVYILAMSTNYDLSTASGGSSYTANWPSEIAVGVCFYIASSGEKMWIYDSNPSTIYQYTMSSAFDLSTASLDTAGSPATAVGFDLSSISPNISSAFFYMGDDSSSLPTKLWLRTLGEIYTYTMSTPGDITTATYTSVSSINSGVSNAFTMQVTDDYLYVSSDDNTDAFVNAWLLDKTSDSRSSRSICRFAANAIYDAIGSDAADVINWDQLDTLDTTLEARGDYFDADFSDETTLWEALKVVFLPGYTEPAMRESRLYPVRTVAGSDYSHLYTPDFMKGEGVLIEDQFYDGLDPDGVDVEYYSNETGEMEVVECRLSGDLGSRTKKISLVGVTDETKAWRIGMRERRRLRYKPGTLSFTTEMDALNSEYGDAIGVTSDIFGSQAGTVTAASGANITLDFSPAYDSSTSPMPQYYAAFKNPRGQMSGLYPISMGSPNNVIVIASSPGLDFTPVTDSSPESDGENTTVAIGTADEWGVRAIARNIIPKGDDEVEVISEEYVAEIYADDDNAPS